MLKNVVDPPPDPDPSSSLTYTTSFHLVSLEVVIMKHAGCQQTVCISTKWPQTISLRGVNLRAGGK